MILDLLSGFAIELLFPTRCNFFFGPGGSGCLADYSRTVQRTQGNPLKKPEKWPFLRLVIQVQE
jgi:hypothetical protein